MKSWIHPVLSCQNRIRIFLETLMLTTTGVFISLFYANARLALVPTALISLISLGRLFFEERIQKGMDWLFRWRWLIALAVFVVMVVFQLHFSSAASYGQIFTPDPSVKDSILFGQPQTIRTDEYSVQLPYYFSQFYNRYSQTSFQMSLSGQDMILGYNAPVWGISLIGKPFVWGYLLFGNAYGLSWYFASKSILMLMTGIEAFRILFAFRHRHLSVLASFVLSFAPAMQWWFSPHFYDVVFWVFALFVIGYWFFKSCGWKQWAFSILAIAALYGFTLALFPSLQVVLGLLMLALLGACLIRDHSEIGWRPALFWKAFMVLAGAGALVLLSLGSMKEGLNLLMNTAYPGKRIVTGGYGSVDQLFLNLSSPILPFLDAGQQNNSEISTFTHFGVACMIGYPWLYARLSSWSVRDGGSALKARVQKKAGENRAGHFPDQTEEAEKAEGKKAVHNSRVDTQMRAQRWPGSVLFAALVLEALFLLVGMPEWLARLTLLSYANRMDFVFGLTAVLFTFWFLAMVSSLPISSSSRARTGALIAGGYALLSLVSAPAMMYPPFLERYGAWFFYGLAALLAFGFWLAFTSWKSLFFCGLVCWTAVSGCCVNPLMQGTAAIEDYAFLRVARKEIEASPDALWLALGEDQVQGLLLANGARVFNAVSFYPDVEKWKLLDPEGTMWETENRYSHMEVHLKSSGETEITLLAPDLIRLDLPVSELKRLGIAFLVAHQKEKELLAQAGISTEILFEDPAAGDLILKLIDG